MAVFHGLSTRPTAGGWGAGRAGKCWAVRAHAARAGTQLQCCSMQPGTWGARRCMLAKPSSAQNRWPLSPKPVHIQQVHTIALHPLTLVRFAALESEHQLACGGIK